MRSISKNEIKVLTYCDKGTPLYIVTRHKLNGSYKLYECKDKELIYLKTRKTDPLFKEVNPTRK